MTDRYPLSPMQQGMLFHTLLDTQAGQYVGQVIFDFPDADLDVGAFQQSWDHVVARHPTLRTSFHCDGDAPVQRVHAGADLPFAFEDWRDLSAAGQKGRLDAYLRSDRQRGFTLTEAPLMRVALFRIGETHHQCV